jgi:DNA-binding transcriptional MerR regulator
MSIGELSARSGVSTRSIRHYETLGLITPQRGANGYRSYGEQAITLVSTVHAIFELGFTRDDVRAVLPCATGERPHGDAELLARVEDMRARVDERIRVLAGTRDALTDFLRTAPSRDAVPVAV